MGKVLVAEAVGLDSRQMAEAAEPEEGRNLPPIR